MNYIEILTVGVLFFWFLPLNVSPPSFRDILRSGRWSEHTRNGHSWGCLAQPEIKRQGEGILRMEDAVTSEEEDTDSQDFNIQYL